MSVSLFLFLMGSILLIGAIGNYFFSRTRVPTSVILMMIGVILGPIAQVLQGSDFQSAAPYFGTVALILILFQGGLELDLREAINQARPAFLLGFIHFFMAALLVFLIARFVFDQSNGVALLYGFVLGGTSPAVILPMIHGLSVSAQAKTLYSLETVVTEVLTVVATVLTLRFTTTEHQPSVTSASLFVVHSFGTATLIAVLAAWAWNWIIPLIERSGISQLVTLAALFLLYGFAGLLHAEPAITVLIFGLLLENGHHVSDWLKKVVPFGLHRYIDFPVKNDKRIFSTLYFELSFLIRTYFFVLVGLLFNFSEINWQMTLFGALILFALYISRQVSLSILHLADDSLPPNEKRLGLATLPRGLATAVVALMVQDSGLPGASRLVTLAFLCILGTNLVMVVLLRAIPKADAT